MVNVIELQACVILLGREKKVLLRQAFIPSRVVHYTMSSLDSSDNLTSVLTICIFKEIFQVPLVLQEPNIVMLTLHARVRVETQRGIGIVSSRGHNLLKDLSLLVPLKALLLLVELVDDLLTLN